MGDPSPITEEFRALLHSAGWNRAEAARRLQMTPASMSLFFRGVKTPRPSTMDLLRRLVSEIVLEEHRLDEGHSVDEPDYLAEIKDVLDTIPESKREQFISAMREVAAMVAVERPAENNLAEQPPRKALKYPPHRRRAFQLGQASSSKVASAAGGSLTSAVAAAKKNVGEGLSPSSGAGGTSDQTDRPGPASRSRSGRRPVIPKPAPTEPTSAEETD